MGNCDYLMDCSWCAHKTHPSVALSYPDQTEWKYVCMSHGADTCMSIIQTKERASGQEVEEVEEEKKVTPSFHFKANFGA